MPSLPAPAPQTRSSRPSPRTSRHFCLSSPRPSRRARCRTRPSSRATSGTRPSRCAAPDKSPAFFGGPRQNGPCDKTARRPLILQSSPPVRSRKALVSGGFLGFRRPGQVESAPGPWPGRQGGPREPPAKEARGGPLTRLCSRDSSKRGGLGRSGRP